MADDSGATQAAQYDCLFCKIVAGEIPSIKVYEDERVLAFMDINPVNDGHLLIVPKRHADSLLDIDTEDLQMVVVVAQGLARILRRVIEPDGLNLLQNNGRAAGQLINHFHLHVIPRKKDDALSGLNEWPVEPGDMDAITELAEKIKAHIG